MAQPKLDTSNFIACNLNRNFTQSPGKPLINSIQTCAVQKHQLLLGILETAENSNMQNFLSLLYISEVPHRKYNFQTK
jgi:hypothetical protein